MRSVYVFCADGFEEVEGLTAVDFIEKSWCFCDDGFHYGEEQR